MEFYNTYNNYLKQIFGGKVYKISLNAGFSCPNRDGTLSKKGCIYCNELSFSPSKKLGENLETQIKIGIEKLNKRYKNIKYFLGYLQPNTNTYADVDTLYKIYTKILNHPKISGLIIGTRPDCIDKEKISMINELAQKYYISLELGLQSMHNKSLIWMNRGHLIDAFENAMKLVENTNIEIGVHVILGLPTETEEEMLENAKYINKFKKIKIVKIHNLHVVKNTPLEILYKQENVKILSLEEYAPLVVKFIGYLDKDKVIARIMGDSPKEYLIAPYWVLEKQKALKYIEETFKKLGIAQGSLL